LRRHPTSVAPAWLLVAHLRPTELPTASVAAAAFAPAPVTLAPALVPPLRRKVALAVSAAALAVSACSLVIPIAALAVSAVTAPETSSSFAVATLAVTLIRTNERVKN